jgi:hypothetical protein
MNGQGIGKVHMIRASDVRIRVWFDGVHWELGRLQTDVWILWLVFVGSAVRVDSHSDSVRYARYVGIHGRLLGMVRWDEFMVTFVVCFG